MEGLKMGDENYGFGMPPKEDAYQIYVGTPVIAHFQAGTVCGVYNGKRNGVAEFNPSLVANPDNSFVTLQTDLPTIFSLPILGMRPLAPNMLENTVNASQKKEPNTKPIILP